MHQEEQSQQTYQRREELASARYLQLKSGHVLVMEYTMGSMRHTAQEMHPHFPLQPLSPQHVMHSQLAILSELRITWPRFPWKNNLIEVGEKRFQSYGEVERLRLDLKKHVGTNVYRPPCDSKQAWQS